jgi:hypothetical protein
MEANAASKPSLMLQRSAARFLESSSSDDESIVLFHAASGETHCLNLVDATAFRHLPPESPIAFDQWLQQVAGDLDVDVDNDLVTYLQELAEQFIQLGIAHYFRHEHRAATCRATPPLAEN